MQRKTAVAQQHIRRNVETNHLSRQKQNQLTQESTALWHAIHRCTLYLMSKQCWHVQKHNVSQGNAVKPEQYSRTSKLGSLKTHSYSSRLGTTQFMHSKMITFSVTSVHEKAFIRGKGREGWAADGNVMRLIFMFFYGRQPGFSMCGKMCVYVSNLQHLFGKDHSS